MTDGFSRKGFNADLDLGKMREDSLGAKLNRQLGPWLELKYDEKCRSTGNLFVEIRQPDRANGGSKPSGLASSTADYWAFEYDQDSYLIVPKSRLVRIAKDTKAKFGTKRGGDFNAYEGILIPAERLVLPEILWQRVRDAA